MRPSHLLPAILVVCCQAMHAQQPMAIPPALDLDTFDLVVDEHVHQFYPGINTDTYGASAEYLGPTLIMHTGDSARIRLHNELSTITNMHWHGLHVPGEHDGGPPREVLPGETWMAEYEVRNPAGTYWYHPHPHELTVEQANRGIAGFILVKDDAEAALDLPRTYGVDDFPVVVQDRKFNSSGNFILYPYGDSVLVNGTPHAYVECPAQVVRLRLLNGSNARIYALGLDNGMPMQVIAGDGGLLAAPVATDRLWLSNGERAEVLLDLSGLEGDSLLLVSYGSELPQSVPGSNNMLWESSSLNGVDFPVLRIRVGAPTADPVWTVPATLVPNVVPDPELAVRSRTKVLSGTGMVGMGMFMINGQMFDLDVVNDTMQLGTTEVWTIVNNSNMAHPMHIHGVSFWILERNGEAPPLWERGPKDVVLVDHLDTVKLVMRFETLTNGWPYMYHCHNLMHEDNMMMLQYIVEDVTVSVPSASDAIVCRVFPNPAADHLSFRSEVPVVAVSLVDGLGRCLIRKSVGGAAQGELSISNLPPGVYALIVDTKSGVVRRSFVKE